VVPRSPRGTLGAREAKAAGSIRWGRV